MKAPSTDFNYSLRVSARAKHVRLSVKPFKGLEIVVPKRFPKKQIPRILQQHEGWITIQLEKHQHSLGDIQLPDCITLSALMLELPVKYQAAPRAKLLEQDDLLTIQNSCKEQVIPLLRNWIRQKARQSLPPMLRTTASELGFTFNKTTIRSQKSRWGSCSSTGTISLNDQLLFMPPATVRYLMIHELCHTRHMNHSASFWRLVESCCADYKIHDKILSKGREVVPAWFSASLYQ